MKITKAELRAIILEAVKELKSKLEQDKQRQLDPKEPKDVGDKQLLLDDDEKNED
jgi:hypothetical protein